MSNMYRPFAQAGMAVSGLTTTGGSGLKTVDERISFGGWDNVPYGINACALFLCCVCSCVCVLLRARARACS